VSGIRYAFYFAAGGIPAGEKSADRIRMFTGEKAAYPSPEEQNGKTV
jgi:hypothetical protein